MAIRWPHWIYAGVGILTLISAAGYCKYLFVRIIRKKGDVLLSNSAFLLMTLAALLAFGATLLHWGSAIGAPAQGRYLFPALPAFAVLFIVGLKIICPKRMDPYLPPGFIILMVSLDFYSLVGRLFPYFHLR